MESTHSNGPRKIIRLAGYDYSQAGAYSITVCAHDRACLWGEIVDGEMVLNELGRIVAEEWQNLPAHYPHILLDEFMVMPNHFHGILFLDPPENRSAEDTASHVPTRQFGEAVSGSLAAILGNFKSGVTRRIREHVGRPLVVWQARFHDHILRDHRDFINHRNYILQNPINWASDEHNPDYRPAAHS